MPQILGGELVEQRSRNLQDFFENCFKSMLAWHYIKAQWNGLIILIQNCMGNCWSKPKLEDCSHNDASSHSAQTLEELRITKDLLTMCSTNPRILECLQKERLVKKGEPASWGNVIKLFPFLVQQVKKRVQLRTSAVANQRRSPDAYLKVAYDSFRQARGDYLNSMIDQNSTDSKLPEFCQHSDLLCSIGQAISEGIRAQDLEIILDKTLPSPRRGNTRSIRT